MAKMIMLLTKKRFRFRNPHKSMIKNETVGVGAEKTTVQVESGAKFEEAFFEIPPDKLTPCPEWVRTDPMFEWGTKEGSILEVVPKSTEAQADAARKQDDEQRAAAESEEEEKKAEEAANFAKMTKIDLLKYASDNFQLELSAGMTKDTIIAAIEEAQKDAAEEGN